MKKIWAVLAVMLLSGAGAYAEDPVAKWKITGIAGFTYGLTEVSSNWTGTEKNSKSWMGKFDATLERDDATTNWANTLKEEFGKARQAGSDETTSADLIDFRSIVLWKYSIYVNPYVSGLVTTQNSAFLDPVTYTESAGVGFWLLKRPEQNLMTKAGIALRQKYDSIKWVTNATTGLSERYSSLDKPETAKIEDSLQETGGEWITNYDLLLTPNTKFVSEARVFSAFKGGANLRWDSSLYLKAGKYLTTQVGYLLIYDFDRIPRRSWPSDIETRFLVTIGMSFNLFS
jgi:hypothetical protein